jgi:hypothetical protein
MLTARINEVYMHDHGKIILFNSQEEVNYFVQGFINYSTQQAMKQGKIFDVGEIMAARNNVVVDEWREGDEKSCTCGTIKYEELKR